MCYEFEFSAGEWQGRRLIGTAPLDTLTGPRSPALVLVARHHSHCRRRRRRRLGRLVRNLDGVRLAGRSSTSCVLALPAVWGIPFTPLLWAPPPLRASWSRQRYPRAPSACEMPSTSSSTGQASSLCPSSSYRSRRLTGADGEWRDRLRRWGGRLPPRSPRSATQRVRLPRGLHAAPPRGRQPLRRWWVGCVAVGDAAAPGRAMRPDVGSPMRLSSLAGVGFDEHVEHLADGALLGDGFS